MLSLLNRAGSDFRVQEGATIEGKSLSMNEDVEERDNAVYRRTP